MSSKAAKPITARAPLPAVEADERDRDEVDGVLARNHDVLNASIQRAREEIARGRASVRSVDDIIAEGRRRHGAD